MFRLTHSIFLSLLVAMSILGYTSASTAEELDLERADIVLVGVKAAEVLKSEGKFVDPSTAPEKLVIRTPHWMVEKGTGPFPPTY